ncbi:hypothetical protein JTE90_005319 [Oedothorax gibbosus]|uniref:Uncharacterized protein n=1 Tax=Oedothorax gibbosus TaxID=931172 RepID=A0AAV6UHB8_9ARAC|nr:hypothetical protein JTE90_005319 [Oedothorax gibbosus]
MDTENIEISLPLQSFVNLVKYVPDNERPEFVIANQVKLKVVYLFNNTETLESEINNTETLESEIKNTETLESEHQMENPAEHQMENTVETPIDNPVETPIDNPVETPIDNPADIETPADIPVDNPVNIETPTDNPVNIPVDPMENEFSPFNENYQNMANYIQTSYIPPHKRNVNTYRDLKLRFPEGHFYSPSTARLFTVYHDIGINIYEYKLKQCYNKM